MEIKQKLSFKKSYKKLKQNQKTEANKALQEIINNPFIGEQKKGDLSWLYVHKFKMLNQLTLIGYSFDKEQIVLTFIAISSHENFYRDLKN